MTKAAKQHRSKKEQEMKARHEKQKKFSKV